MLLNTTCKHEPGHHKPCIGGKATLASAAYTDQLRLRILACAAIASSQTNKTRILNDLAMDVVDEKTRQNLNTSDNCFITRELLQRIYEREKDLVKPLGTYKDVKIHPQVVNGTPR